MGVHSGDGRRGRLRASRGVVERVGVQSTVQHVRVPTLVGQCDLEHGVLVLHDAKLAASLDRRVAGCEWAHGFKFADFVRPRIYDSLDVQSVILPGVLRYFDVEEL